MLLPPAAANRALVLVQVACDCSPSVDSEVYVPCGLYVQTQSSGAPKIGQSPKLPFIRIRVMLRHAQHIPLERGELPGPAQAVRQRPDNKVARILVASMVL